MSSEFTHEVAMKFLPAQVSLIMLLMSWKQFYTLKDFSI